MLICLFDCLLSGVLWLVWVFVFSLVWVVFRDLVFDWFLIIGFWFDLVFCLRFAWLRVVLVGFDALMFCGLV